ncbi:hypothetical protein KAR48_06115 [bacterium]|nr:hypothetical protein [bacterium]
MKSKILIIHALLALTISVFGQTEKNHMELTRQIETLTTRLDSIAMARSALQDRAGNLGREISHLQSIELLSSAERRRLNRYMRQSQELSQKMNALEQRYLHSSNLQQLLLQDLLKNIQIKLDSLMATDAPDQLQLQNLSEAHRRWSTLKHEKKDVSGSWTSITARQGDSPRTLEFKGDLLKDRSEALKVEAMRVSSRVDKLEREVRIRSRVADMDRELSLFNESEELFARSTRSSSNPNGTGPDYREEDFQNEILTNKSGSIFLDRPLMELTGTPPTSPIALRDWIARLKIYEARLQQEADSLAVIAQTFYLKADERKH